jgi:hypothetical protein
MAKMFSRNVPDGQISIVNLTAPVVIDDQGYYKPTQNLFFEGYMGWEKIADLVPFDYESNNSGIKNYGADAPNR